MFGDLNKLAPTCLPEWGAPAKNFSAAKNRQKLPTFSNDKLLNGSGLLTTSPLNYDWQSNKQCVSERVRCLFANTTLADVYFNIKHQPNSSCNSTTATPTAAIIDESSCASPEPSPPATLQRIPAHSFVLAISSAVFEAMFYGPMSSNNQRGTSSAPRNSWPLIADTNAPSLSTPSIVAGGNADQLMQTIDLQDNDGITEERNKTYTENLEGPSSPLTPSSNLPIEIHLNDVHPVAFLNVLRFIYTDEILLDPGNVLQTLYVAKKYAITVMEHACVDFLSQSITVDNAFMLLAQANFFDEPELSQKCLELIDKNTAKTFDSDEFLAIDDNLLCSVLDRDTLCIREVRLFISVLKWAQAEYRRRNPDRPSPATERHRPNSPNLLPSSPISDPPRPASNPQPPSYKDTTPVGVGELQEVLRPVLPHIRFPQMSIEEFAEVVVPSGVLEDSKVVNLFLWFISSHSKPEIPYCVKPRCFLHGVEEVVRRFGAVDQRWDYRGTSDRIRFMVNRKIYVVGFGLYGSIHGQSTYDASIEIVHPESGVVLGSNDVSYLADGSPNIFRVAFKEPIPLTPHVNYLASATIKGLDTYYGTRGLREIEHECSSSSAGKVTFRFSYAACNNNGTSVEDGQIPEIIFFI